jgi:hypothetical protein
MSVRYLFGIAASVIAAWAIASSGARAQALPSPLPPPSREVIEDPIPAAVPPENGTRERPEPPSFNGTSSQMGGSLWDSPVLGHAVPRADYRIYWFPEEHVGGQPTNLAMVRQDLSLWYPIWQDCVNEVAGSVHVRGEIFSTEAVLPNTGKSFPDELWNIRLGANYRHLFDNGWIAGGGVSFGSASDKPFHSIDEMTVGVNGFLRIPQGERNAWLFTLAYSPTSELAFPVPGVAFLWWPTDNFRMNIGLPFQINYRPIDEVTIDFSYMLLHTVHARVTYRPIKPLRFYVAYDWDNESYFLADRADVNDRLFYYDQRVTGGVAYDVCRGVALDLSGGYVFDRFYFEGQHFSDQNNNRLNVGDGPFVALQCRVRW